jgi:uncharacterized membrane protein YkvA (DUF1232 family)
MKIIKHLIVISFGLVSAVYLFNPGAGIIDIIPDNIPVVGNLDEAAATLLLINCLAYFGLDLNHFIRPNNKKIGKADPQ